MEVISMSDEYKLQEILEQLHNAVAENLLEKIKSGKAVAADLQAAIALLKHNKIYLLPEKSEMSDALAQEIQKAFEQEFNAK